MKRPGAWGALCVLLVGCASAGDNAQLRVLEAEKRAREVQLETLRRAGETDLRLRDLRRDALKRAQAVRPDTFRGAGAFLIIRRAWFAEVVAAVLPVKMKAGGFGWKFKNPQVEFSPDGVRVKMKFQVTNARIKSRLGRAAGGHITGVLALRPDPDRGGVRLEWKPLSATLDDEDFRMQSLVFKKLRMNEFEGMLPPLPIPLVPSPSVQCCGRRADLAVELSADDAVVLSEGLLLPFGIRLDKVVVLPPEPEVPSAPAEDPDAPPSVTPAVPASPDPVPQDA